MYFAIKLHINIDTHEMRTMSNILYISLLSNNTFKLQMNIQRDIDRKKLEKEKIANT